MLNSVQREVHRNLGLFFVFAALMLGSVKLAWAEHADVAARKAQVEKLSLSEQQELLRNHEKFLALTPEEQEQMRRLDAELSQAPEEKKFRATLERYHEWLKTLRPEQRAELAELSPDERIVRIKQFVERQQDEQERRRQRFAGGAPPLPQSDARLIAQWFGDMVWERRDELLANMPEARREELKSQDDAAQRRALMYFALRRQPQATPEQIDQLVTKLSSETQKRFENNGGQRERLARELVWQALATRMGNFQRRRSMATASSEEMEQFFENELPEEDRQRLMNLPRDQMREELNSLYFRHLREKMGRPPGPPFGRGDRDRPRRPLGEGRGPGGPGRGRDDFPGGFPPRGRDREGARPDGPPERPFPGPPDGPPHRQPPRD